MKTVAIVINTSWNIINFRMGLLKALQKNGYRVVAIAPIDEYSKKFEDLGVEFHNIIINNKGTNPFEEIKLIFDFYRLYKEIKPDVLLHYTIKPNIYGNLAARILKIPVISNVSGLGTVFLSDGLSSKIARKLYKIALRFPKKVFYQNKHDRDLFVSSHLVSIERTDVLPGSGIDINKFKPIVNSLIKNNSLRFLFIARLLKDKGLIEFIEAAKRMKQKYPKVEFQILGAYYPGNPTAITQVEMQEWINDDIINYLDTSDNVKSVVATADCIVLPSYREGLSRVLLEGASMAKPLITTNVPGCKEVVDDGVNGFLCKVKDSRDLADKMEKMLNLNEEQRIEMGKNGREKIIKQFDEKIVIDKYMENIMLITGAGDDIG